MVRVAVLDYGEIEAIITISEMIRRKKDKKPLTVGNKFFAVVLSCDESGIMLSKNKANKENQKELTSNYTTRESITRLGIAMCNFYRAITHKSEDVSEELYEKIMGDTIWPWYDLNNENLMREDYERCISVKNVEKMICGFPKVFKELFISFIADRTTETKITLSSEVSVEVCEAEGVDKIKKILSVLNEDVIVTILVPPVYRMSVSGFDKDELVDTLKQCECEVLSHSCRTTKCLVKNSCSFPEKRKRAGIKPISVQEIKKWLAINHY